MSDLSCARARVFCRLVRFVDVVRGVALCFFGTMFRLFSAWRIFLSPGTGVLIDVAVDRFWC